METRDALTPAQQQVLEVLVRLAGRVARREDIYHEAFGRPLPPKSRAVDLHIARIRRALGEGTIVTVGRVGYRIDPARLPGYNADTQRLHA